MIANTAMTAITTGIGRRITVRAVCAQRPSSFGVIALLRTTPLSTFSPRIARSAGRAMTAPTIANEITAMPA